MSDAPVTARREPWVSLWVVALLSLAAQLALCQFFTWGHRVPESIDINPSSLWKNVYQWPPRGEFLVLNWLGIPNLPPPLNPFTLATHLTPWLFFSTYAPVVATLALLAMAAFLRELELPRPAALFGGLIYAWQGDLLPFVFPGHYAYITIWPYFALAAWAALRGPRTGLWPYALISGVSCGTMVGLQPDQGGIASLLIAALYLGPALAGGKSSSQPVRQLGICVAVALAVALAPLLGLFQSNIEGVTLGGSPDREQTFAVATQFSLGPAESLTYLIPGLFGWHSSNPDGPYWGWIGQRLDWARTHEGRGCLNLAISTTGTVATLLALVGLVPLLPGGASRLLGASTLTDRQRFFGRVLLILGAVALVLSWGWHTPIYRALFTLPLMDKWRNPLKWLVLTNFFLVTLSAYGIQHILRSLDPARSATAATRQRLLYFLGGVLVLLFLGLLASYPLGIVLEANLTAATYQPFEVNNAVATMHIALAVAIFSTFLLGAALYAAWHPEFLRAWELPNPWLHRLWHYMMSEARIATTLPLAFGALAILQLAWVVTQFILPVDLKSITQTDPLVDALKSEGTATRVSVDTTDPLLNVLLLNQFAADRISCLDISAASRYPEALENFFHTMNSDRARMWFLAGVKTVGIPQEGLAALRADKDIAANIEGADGYSLLPTSSPDTPSHALVHLRDYLGKATLVPELEVLPDDAAVLERLTDPNWNPRERLLLTPEAAAQLPPPAPAPPDVSDMLALEDYTPHEIRLHAVTHQAGYVLINDAYDPDWQAFVNDRAAPQVRADYIFRAVPLPAGTSTLTLRYVAHYRLGRIVLPAVAVNLFSDGAMLAGWIAAGLLLRRRVGVSS